MMILRLKKSEALSRSKSSAGLWVFFFSGPRFPACSSTSITVLPAPAFKKLSQISLLVDAAVAPAQVKTYLLLKVCKISWQVPCEEDLNMLQVKSVRHR
ncbi:hypothetical protein GUJ93_ZPchr0002g25580 [Zizania palustris]|uniref:Uncharacterized protein n=1 Tax=Zizania palustris TaxID=103762 RepID=A0A8J5S9J5_ZIZPA|nr:hypothetical protein GUJ93_ZPchr0002g25580 [Zizania palustris]